MHRGRRDVRCATGARHRKPARKTPRPAFGLIKKIIDRAQPFREFIFPEKQNISQLKLEPQCERFHCFPQQKILFRKKNEVAALLQTFLISVCFQEQFCLIDVTNVFIKSFLGWVNVAENLFMSPSLNPKITQHSAGAQPPSDNMPE